MSPAITADGTGFGVAWVSRPGATPPPGPATLHFTRTSLDGKPFQQKGIAVTSASNSTVPAMAHRKGEYAVMYHNGSSPALARIDEDGKMLASTSFPGVRSYAVAAHSSGFVVLHSRDKSPARLMLTSFLGAPSTGTVQVHSGGQYFSLWITQRASGFALAWDGSFALMDAKGATKVVQPLTKKYMSSPAFTTAGSGYGTAYARASDFRVEVQPMDAAGKPKGSPKEVGQASISASPLRQISLVWTGRQYVVLFHYNDFKAQLVDPDGSPVGALVKLPSCMSFSYGRSGAAWQSGRLGVVYEAGLSGPTHSAICLAVLKCQQ